MYTIEEYPFHDLTIRIVPDDDAESPRTYDNLGHMVCWHSRYDLGDQQVRPNDHYSLDEFLTSLVDDYSPTVVLPLYLLDHSGITIKAGEKVDLAELFIPDREPFTFDPGGWDTSFVGFILDTADTRKMMGNVPEEVEEVLRHEVAAYANWLEGGYVAFIVEDSDGNHLDSLWGIDDLDYAKECAEDSADWEAQRIEREKREAFNRETVQHYAGLATYAFNPEGSMT